MGSRNRSPHASTGLYTGPESTQAFLRSGPENRLGSAAIHLPGEQECARSHLAGLGEYFACRVSAPDVLERRESLLFQPGPRSRPVSATPPLLSLRLSADYPNKPNVLRDVSFEMYPGEILGLVGQSGSGKSTLALAILRLLHLRRGGQRGEIWFQGRSLMSLSEREMRALRGRELGLVLQSPLSALNPALRIGTQLEEAWRAHADGSRDAVRSAILETLSSVSLPAEAALLRRYPSQLSVGQAQRVIIAMAILHRPALLIADEPTSALDSITQAEILSLFARLNRELDMAILYISHDLLSVAALCHRIAILHEGQFVECGSPTLIFGSPQHEYTRRLIAALPNEPLHGNSKEEPSLPKEVLAGRTPS